MRIFRENKKYLPNTCQASYSARMPTNENLSNYILRILPKMIAGVLMLADSFILKELLNGDGIGLRLAGVTLMVLLVVVVRFKWTKRTFKLGLSEIVTSLRIGKFELLQLAMLAGSKYLSHAFAQVTQLRIRYVKATVATTIKTVSATNSAAQAHLKSALRAVAVTLTPKLLPIPQTARA